MLKLERRRLRGAAPGADAPARTRDEAPPDSGSRSIDRLLKLSGLALAAVCALLPWAAYEQHAAKSHVVVANNTKVKDPLDRSRQHVFLDHKASPDATSRRADLQIDPSTTGSTSRTGGAARDRPKAVPPQNQPFPARPEFLLRDVVGGMGMIEDQTGFWFVEKGSLLPDASRVVSISKDHGLWEITTDTGRHIRQTK